MNQEMAGGVTCLLGKNTLAASDCVKLGAPPWFAADADGGGGGASSKAFVWRTRSL